MLAFGALVDLSLAPLPPDHAARLRQSLPEVAGRVEVLAAGDHASAHLADERFVSFDAGLPLVDGDLVVAGTLRIDAQEALRAALAPDAPRALAALPDAGLVMHAYRRWGVRLAEHLIGDYAFAIWDRRAGRLVCARDPHGNRQLFWGRVGSRVVVGSTLEIVRCLPGVSSALHEPSLVSLLRDGWVEEAERTVYRDVRRLPAAHTLVLSADAAPVVRRHWEFPVPAPIRYRRDDEYVEHFREVLHAAVRDRLRAGRAALFLSGGMDSSMLAAASRAAAPEVTLRAFTMTYPTLAPSDDDTLSVAVAARLGVPHTLCDLDHTRVLSHLDAPDALLSQPLDEPDYGLARESLRGVAAFAPIAVDGEDGDWLLQAPTLLGQLRTQPLAEVVGSWSRYWWRTGERPWVGLEWRERLRRLREGGAVERAPWMRPGFHRTAAYNTQPGPPHPLRPRNVRALSSPLWDAAYETSAPAATRLPLLITLPLVDPRVVAFVFAIPPVPWSQRKQLFRAAMRDALPATVLAHPKTPLAGFIEARVAQWRAGGGAETPISDRVAPWVDVDAVRRVFRAGPPYAVLEAWRVLQVDRWLAREAHRHA